MIKTKRILCIFLVVLMLFTSLPINVFAQEATTVGENGTAEEQTATQTEEETTKADEVTEYEVGKEYTINGVRYRMGDHKFADVLGEGEGMSETVEILSHIGDYTVKSISYGAFDGCKTVKKVILPETVTLILPSFSGSGLTEIEIKGKNVDVRTDFRNTPLYENPDNWQNDVLIVSGYAVASKAQGSVVLGEDIVGIGEDCFGYGSRVTNLIILNPNCHIFNSSGTLPPYATIYGYKGSTAVKHAAAHRYKFSVLCGCKDAVFKPETYSYCNGVIGYSEGYWCEKCNTYSSGGYIKDETYDHTDVDGDNICDFCKCTTDTEIVDVGKCGDNAFWCLTKQGVLIVGGEGVVEKLDKATERHLQIRRINEVVFLDGITMIADNAFDYVVDVEKITVSDTVTEIRPKAFYQCGDLKELILGKGLKKIGTQAFAYSGSLQKVVLHEGLTVIGAGAFWGCRQLSEINLPTTLETIGVRAFEDCKKLKDVNFYGSLKSIGERAFYNCTALTKIVIPESVEMIGQVAFSDCTNLADIEMKAKYLIIYSNSFSGCPGFSKPEDVKNGFRMLGTVAFYETKPIHTEIILGEEITSLADFWPCGQTQVRKIYVKDRRCYIGNSSIIIDNLVVYGYKGSYAEGFAKNVKAFFVPICECENTKFFPAAKSSCDGTLGFTAGEWCDYCQTWKSGHEINTAEMHNFGEDSEICLDCGAGKEEKIVSTGIINGGFWTLNSDNELVVYGKGTVSLPDGTQDIKRWLKVIGEDAKSVRIRGTIEKIGKELFKDGTSLEKIEVENGVYSIGEKAFYNCKNVKEMKLSVVLLEIGASAFEPMPALKSVTLPSTVYKIGDAVFKNCTSLKEVTFEGEFYNIPDELFYNCTSLEKVKFKNTYINNVGQYAFYKCISLKAMPLPVKGSIDSYAFSGCKAIKEVTITSPTVWNYVFQNCTGLETVSINRDTSMHAGVFEGCSSLKNVNFAQGKKITMSEQGFKGCTSLESITLPVTWTTVPQSFFYGCTSLKNVIIPDTVTSIRQSTFNGCTSLKSIDIPDAVETIGSSAFYGCRSLSEITLSENVTSVGSMAFYGANNLSKITFLNKETEIAVPVSIYEDRCNAIPVTTLIIGYSASTADVYADNYGNRFQPLDEKPVKEISIETYPVKTYYVLNKDRVFNADGLSIKVTYEDGTTRVFKNRFAVDASKCDLTKEGVYTVKVTFENKEAFFDISVTKTDDPLQQNVVLPEYGELNFKYNKTRTVNVKFIPKETRTYYFMTLGNDSESIRMPTGSYKYFSQSYKKDFNKLEIDLIKGEVYYITLKCGAGSSVTLKQTGICDIEKLPDGTYKTVRYLGDRSNVVIPSEINGKKITVIGENSFEGAGFKNITLGEGIKVIEKNAFVKNNYIKSVTLPGSLKTIGEKAFYKLQTLKTVNGGNNVEEIGNSAFNYCTRLENFTLSEKVKTIGNKAFYGCDFTSITFPESLKKAGEGAFRQCNKLREINFLSKKVDFGDGVFGECYLLEKIALPVNNTEIVPVMFEACTALTEIVLPANIESIGQAAFYNCNNVKSIKFNDKIKYIGNSAFALCESLVSVEIPESVTDLGENLFSKCDSLEEVSFLSEITEIPDAMFYSCNNLKRINYNGTITIVGDEAFRGCVGFAQNELLTTLTYIGKYAFSHTNLTEISINENIEHLGAGAFEDANVKSVVFPKAVTKIPSGILFGSSVESVTLKGKVAKIESTAFMYCENLKKINGMSSVEIIGEEAFAFTKALGINVNLEGVRKIGKGAFQYSAIKGVTFGGNLQSIADDAFAHTNIEKVAIPEGAAVGMDTFFGCGLMTEAIVGKNASVDYNCFAYNKNLEKVVVEDGATLGRMALNGCKNLKELHFKNTISPESDLGKINSEAVIYGLEESNARRYADKYGFKFVAYEGSAHIHNYQSELLPETKCNVYRKTRYFCSCGKEYTVTAREKTHVYGDFTVEKEPNCTEPGIKSKHCICGKTRTEITVIEPLGHTEIIDIPAVAPTGTEPGYTHQSHCSVCGETVVKRKLIGHSEYNIIINDDFVIANKSDVATSKNDGADITITFMTKNNVCMSLIDKTVIYKVGEVKLLKTKLIYNGKVQKPGVTVKNSIGEPLVLNRDYRVTYSANSKKCGKYNVKVVYIGNYAGSKTLYYEIAHNWGKGKITKSPTCTKTGIKTFSCGCGASYTQTIAKLAHTYDNKCDKTCNICKAGRSVPHSYKSVTTKATLSKNGKIENKCSVCGSVKSTTTVYYPKTFKLSATAYTYNGKAKTPTVIVKDYKGNTLKKNTDYTVTYESGRKLPGKYTVKITFKGKYSGEKKLYFTIVPKAASKITASQTTTTITLKWSKVTGADGYRIYKYNTRTKKWDTVKTVSASTLSCKIKYLKAGAAYKFKVRSYTNDDGTIWGAYSRTFETATKCKTSSITKLTSTKRKAFFTWSNVSGESGYQVYYSTKKYSGYKKVASYKTNVVKGSKRKLTSGKKYYFKVRAYKMINGKTVYGSFSPVKSITIK